VAGRPPVPTALKLLKGTAKKCRLNGEEPVSLPGALCPPHIQGTAREMWKRWAPVYEAMGCLREADTLAFAAWMQIEADILALRQAGEPVGVNMRKQALNYAVQFGGTASARARIHVKRDEPESKLGKFSGKQA
jgi:hypothetical protein